MISTSYAYASFWLSVLKFFDNIKGKHFILSYIDPKTPYARIVLGIRLLFEFKQNMIIFI